MNAVRKLAFIELIQALDLADKLSMSISQMFQDIVKKRPEVPIKNVLGLFGELHDIWALRAEHPISVVTSVRNLPMYVMHEYRDELTKSL